MNAGQNMQVHPTDFAEPPHNFIKSMLAKEIVEQSLADEFFDGNVSLVERKWEGLTDHQLEKFFIDRFGAGPTRAEESTLFCGIRSEWIHGIVSHRVYFENCAEFGNEVHVCFSREINEKLKNRYAEVKAKFPTNYEPGYIQCDLSDPVAVRGMVIQCRTVVNIAGPFMLTPADLLVRNLFIIFFLALSLSPRCLELIIPNLLLLFIRLKRALNTIQITSTLMVRFHSVPSSSNITIGRETTTC